MKRKRIKRHELTPAGCSDPETVRSRADEARKESEANKTELLCQTIKAR